MKPRQSAPTVLGVEAAFLGIVSLGMLFVLKELALVTPLFLSVYAAGCAYLLRALLGGGGSPTARLTATGYVALCLFVWWAPFTSRQAFLRDFHLLRPGMTAAQVTARMERYPWRHAHFPGVSYGTPVPADPQDEIVFLHSADDGGHKADSGRVRFEKGRVVELTVTRD